jgi:putative two-component system response regulator
LDKPTILIIDDEPLNLAVLSQLLNPTYRVLGTRSGASALSVLQKELPDLILLDVMMPAMDGYTLMATLKKQARTAEIPVIFVTALGADVDEEHGLSLGAVDYIVKPIKPAIVLARIRTQLELKAARDRLSDQNEWLECELLRRMRDSLLAQDLTLCAMAELAETRDNETGNHILRTQSYIEVLARKLQNDPAYAPMLKEAALSRIVKAAPMHDIGKIGIRDNILLKPGKLTHLEFEVMKTHARLGGDAIEHAINKALAMHEAQATDVLPESVRFLEVARVIAIHHHERWDGSGYPDGLKGENIPLPARLMALADVFDALTTQRVYKRPWSLSDASRYIVEESGAHFDPRIVQAFEASQDEFSAISTRLADPAWLMEAQDHV